MMLEAILMCCYVSKMCQLIETYPILFVEYKINLSTDIVMIASPDLILDRSTGLVIYWKNESVGTFIAFIQLTSCSPAKQWEL